MKSWYERVCDAHRIKRDSLEARQLKDYDLMTKIVNYLNDEASIRDKQSIKREGFEIFVYQNGVEFYHLEVKDGNILIHVLDNSHAFQEDELERMFDYMAEMHPDLEARVKKEAA